MDQRGVVVPRVVVFDKNLYNKVEKNNNSLFHFISISKKQNIRAIFSTKIYTFQVTISFSLEKTNRANIANSFRLFNFTFKLNQSELMRNAMACQLPCIVS